MFKLCTATCESWANIMTYIVADMRAKGLKLTWQGVVEHLGRIDPDGTLNISATELWERARVLRL